MGRKKTEFPSLVYNRALKEDFMADDQAILPSHHNITMQLFEKSYPLEEQLGKDLGMFSSEELIPVLQSFGYIRFSALHRLSGPIREYMCWYSRVHKNLYIRDFPVPIAEVETWPTLAERLFFSPEDLLAATQPYSADHGSSFQVACCLYWLGYDRQGAYKILQQDVQLANDTVYIQSEPISEPLFAKPLAAYYSQDVFADGTRVKAPGDSFLRRMNHANPKSKTHDRPTTFSSLIQQLDYIQRDWKGRDVSVSALNMAGEMYRMRGLETEDGLSDESLVLARGKSPMSFTARMDVRHDFAQYKKARESLGI